MSHEMVSSQNVLLDDVVLAADCGEIATPAETSLIADTGELPRPRLRQALRYVAIARPHHYAKNVLMLVGAALACVYQPNLLTDKLLLLFGFVATCIIASSNYVLNEILDADSDKFHFSKGDRPIAAGYISPAIAYREWLILGAAGLSIAAWIGWSFFVVAIAFQLMAILYNVPPLRLKDLPYLDVLSEAVNSPLRLLLGWLIVLPSEFPSLSIVFAFWMAGSFEMARKRFKEYRHFRDRSKAAGYRKSFAHYNERRLKVSMAIYALFAVIISVSEVWKL